MCTKSKNNADELFELAKPLIEYFKANYHPHCFVLITSEKLLVTEDLLSIPLFDS